MSNPIPELLTRLFSLLERSSKQIGCRCQGYCSECTRLRYDINGILRNEVQDEQKEG